MKGGGTHKEVVLMHALKRRKLDFFMFSCCSQTEIFFRTAQLKIRGCIVSTVNFVVTRFLLKETTELEDNFCSSFNR